MDQLSARWNHMLKYHPEIPFRLMFQVFQNPRAFGEMLGAQARKRLES